MTKLMRQNFVWSGTRKEMMIKLKTI